MKRTHLALAALALAVFAACSSAPRLDAAEEAEVRAAAQGYLDAMGNYRISDAAPFATQQTRDVTIPAMNYVLAHSDTAYVNSNRPAEITILSVRRVDDTTSRAFYHKHTPIKDVDDSVTLHLEEGHWLVDVRLGFLPALPSSTLPSSTQPTPTK